MPPHPTSDTNADLMAAIAAARSRLGLSQEQLAVKLGLSRPTLAAIWEGRDSRASTLARILSVLGDVVPTDALGHVGRPAVGLAAAWRFDCRLHGAFARSATRDVRVLPDGGVTTSWTVEGVRVRPEDLASADRLADLLRLVVQGGSAVLARLHALAEELVQRRAPTPIEEAGAVHVVALRRGASPELRYERRDGARHFDFAAGDVDSASGCLALGSVALVKLPVRRLVLSLSLPETLGAAEPAALAWLGPLVPEAGEAGLSKSLLASHAKLASRGGRHVLTVGRPPVGLVLGLGWRMPAAASPRRRATRIRVPRERGTAEPLAATLRRVREAEGLSVRELARRMDVGAMTVSDAERARDVRASTLRAFLSALPDLSPWDLLTPSSLSPAQAWAYQRDLFGCAGEVEAKLVEITEEGDARMRIETKGLRLLAARPGPLRLRMGFSAPTVVPTRARLRGVAVPGDRAGTLRISAATGIDGERLHQLTVPETLARQGVTCVRDLLHRDVYALTSSRARERHGTEGPFFEGASFAAVLPVRRLRLVVRFPPGTWPGDVTSHAWPLSKAPDPATAGIASWLHPEGLDLDPNERRREISLTIDRPIIGAKYGIGWRLR